MKKKIFYSIEEAKVICSTLVKTKQMPKKDWIVVCSANVGDKWLPYSMVSDSSSYTRKQARFTMKQLKQAYPKCNFKVAKLGVIKFTISR